MNKKLAAGAAILMLALGTGAVAYAANAKEAPRYQDEISAEEAGGISFDQAENAELPEGVFYQDQVSLEGGDGTTFPLGD